MRGGGGEELCDSYLSFSKWTFLGDEGCDVKKTLSCINRDRDMGNYTASFGE
jgi:hypothetical protein